MLKVKTFLTIFVVMLVVFSLFQFSGISPASFHGGKINVYAEAGQSQLTQTTAKTENFSQGLGKEPFILIADEEDALTAAVFEVATYLKRNCTLYASVRQVPQSLLRGSIVILAGRGLSYGEELPLLQKLTEEKIPVIFARAPSPSTIENTEGLKEYLGIAEILDSSFEMTGMRIFDGFFLGGGAQHDEYEFSRPYYKLSVGTKAYAVGLFEGRNEAETKNEELPALLWRNSRGGGPVFTLNMPAMEDHSALGVFHGILKEISAYTLYPVINAQMVVLQNFPYFAQENSEEMIRRYSQEASLFLQDQLWPGVMSILRKNKSDFTCTVTPQLDYTQQSSLSSDMLYFFMEQIGRENGEVGVSGGAEFPSENQLEQDFSVYDNLLADYTFTVFSSDGMQENAYKETLEKRKFRTLLRPLEEFSNQPFFSYYNDSILQFPIFYQPDAYDTQEALRLQSLQSALAVSVSELDLKRVVFPQGDQDDWVELGREWARNFDTYWTPFRVFEPMLVSEADVRIRRFLALDYTLEEKEDSLLLSLENFDGEAWFLFRSPYRKIVSVTNGQATLVEDGVYLIRGDAAQLELHLAESDRTYFYD